MPSLHAYSAAPGLVEVLREVKLTVDENEVRGLARIPLELIERLAKETTAPARRPNLTR